MPSPGQIITEDITNRFIEAYENLKALKKVKNQADFARRIGYPAPAINNILNKTVNKRGARRYPTLDMVYTLCINPTFEINTDWLITGRPPMFRPMDRPLTQIDISKTVNEILKKKKLI